MKIHPIFMTLLGSIIIADSSVVFAELRGQPARQRRANLKQGHIEVEEIPLPSDFPSMTPSSAPTTNSKAQSPPMEIKVCNDTSSEDIRFINEDGDQVFGSCSDITENNWDELACPQPNENVYAQGRMIYETCGNECVPWSGCGLLVSVTPSPTSSPSETPSSSPALIKECEDNSNVRFVVTIPSTETTILGQCSDISEKNWQVDLCSLSNERLVGNGVAIYKICGYECQDLSGCGLPIMD